MVLHTLQSYALLSPSVGVPSGRCLQAAGIAACPPSSSPQGAAAVAGGAVLHAIRTRHTRHTCAIPPHGAHPLRTHPSLPQVLVGHPDYEVTAGTATYKGLNLFDLAPEERSHAGLFLR